MGGGGGACPRQAAAPQTGVSGEGEGGARRASGGDLATRHTPVAGSWGGGVAPGSTRRRPVVAAPLTVRGGRTTRGAAEEPSKAGLGGGEKGRGEGGIGGGGRPPVLSGLRGCSVLKVARACAGQLAADARCTLTVYAIPTAKRAAVGRRGEGGKGGAGGRVPQLCTYSQSLTLVLSASSGTGMGHQDSTDGLSST